MARLAIVIARMRSGTTAFRQVLGSNSSVSTLGEVFHSDFEKDKFAFYNYYLQRITRNPEISIPSLENREYMLQGYFDHLAEILHLKEKSEHVLLLGVNYNSLHSLNYFWQNPLSPPHMLPLLRKLGVRVIHLRRTNILETLVSELRARQSGVWHIRGEAEQAPPPVQVDTRTLMLELTDRAQEMALMRKWLSFGEVLDLTYEDTFLPDNAINPAVLEKCAAFLGVPNEFEAAVKYRRTRPSSLREAIENYDAVAALLAVTEFAELLPASE